MLEEGEKIIVCSECDCVYTINDWIDLDRSCENCGADGTKGQVFICTNEDPMTVKRGD